MTTPVTTFGDYVACFDALPEDRDMKEHFMGECGYSRKDYEDIEGYCWFIAKVSIWKGEVSLAETYLGACCYKSIEDFYTRFASDYWSDMVYECAFTIKDEALHAQIEEWWRSLRDVE